MKAHVFVDNSNIFGGAQNTAEEKEPSVPWKAIRVYYKNFFELIEDGDEIETRVLTGSVPPENERLWDYARKNGYNTDLLERIDSDSGSLVEQGVDEAIHLKMANRIIDYEAPQKIILATGDGSSGEVDTSFVDQTERALKEDWSVEVWSWETTLSGNFRQLKNMYSQKLNLNHLDPYYEQITFVSGGEYEVEGEIKNIEDRIVNQL